MVSRHRRSCQSNVQVGDCVRVRDRFPGSKFWLPFEDKPWTVTRCQGSLVVATRGSEWIARNFSWFKKFQPPLLVPDDDIENDSYTAESEEALEEIGPEKPLHHDDSVGNDRALPEQDSAPVISPGGLMSPAGQMSES
ncbi:hypothetical protein NDU88_009583 [Pleurodeles waltl]|uniref:Uncharacterized protein n=1 Tax=Pleurodeles waltl TaxID=8319 RepID=A0AAV7PVN0_PLEWA|nr:hypothetical protein NDU88_009583 [Pleurodeles waltl]